MPRRMACSMTIDAVRDRTKTVTRRHAGSWTELEVGSRLVLIEKGMGLKKGERQVVLAEVEIIRVGLVRLGDIDRADCIAEGFPELTPDQFCSMWCASHKYSDDQHTRRGLAVRRIEWRYLDD